MEEAIGLIRGFRIEDNIERFSRSLKVLIRIMRERAELSQTALAARLDVPPSVISRLENTEDPRKPKFSTFMRIAVACDCNFDINVKRSGEEPQIPRSFFEGQEY
jgi:transcriptional regulator with XRE-family HTH domain